MKSFLILILFLYVALYLVPKFLQNRERFMPTLDQLEKARREEEKARLDAKLKKDLDKMPPGILEKERRRQAKQRVLEEEKVRMGYDADADIPVPLDFFDT